MKRDVDDARSLAVNELQDLLTAYEAHFLRNIKHVLIVTLLVTLVLGVVVIGFHLPRVALAFGCATAPLGVVFAIRQRRRQFLFEHGVTEAVMQQIQVASRRVLRRGTLKLGSKDREEVARQVHAELRET